MAVRLQAAGLAGYAGIVDEHGRWTGRVEMSEKRLTEPLHWRRSRRVFVNSMSDLFHPAVPDEWIDRVWSIMELCPSHTFQVLTKRPERMAKHLAMRRSGGMLLLKPGLPPVGCSDQVADHWGKAVPTLLPHVWLGTSCEDQLAADDRLPSLCKCPTVVRFVSCEPLLGPIVLSDALAEWWESDGLDWVIIGGESGPGARRMDPEWAMSLIKQCVRNGVSVFVKQLGTVLARDMGLRSPAGSDWTEWPFPLRVRQFPTPPPPHGCV
jgi:protein gp37